MQMSKTDIVTYPRFAAYVKNTLPYAATVPAIANAMRTIGQIDSATLKRALAWGQGPTIRVTPIAKSFGEFTPGTQEIRIDTDLVNSLEAGLDTRVVPTGKVSLAGVTLLHELVHWGDDQDGVDRPGEEGDEFERAIYGRVLS